MDIRSKLKNLKAHRLLLSVTALTLAGAVALGGTFAWQNYNQMARNGKTKDINPGGRLHDDYNGTNKDVYVENFTTPGEGTPVYVRIHLDEYMETGPDAGEKGNEEKRDVTPLVEGTKYSDVKTWKRRIPTKSELEGNPDSDDACRKYWKWEFGGQTTYMPTFNKNKDSLKADINGTLEGGDTGTPFGDYVDWTASAPATKSDFEIYDNDANIIDEGNDRLLDPKNIKYSEKEIEHTARLTRTTAKVMLMADWLSLPENERAGDYWVFDTDGWAYWAKPVMPGEATGLLLTGISPRAAIAGKWYYGLNVVAQFATEGEWNNPGNDLEGFRSQTAGEVVSDNAKKLLDNAVKSVPTIVLTAAENTDMALPGRGLQFNAAVKFGGQPADAPKGKVIWSMVSDKPVAEGTSLSQSGVLTVAEGETLGTKITVTATTEASESVYASRTVTVGYPMDKISVDSVTVPGAKTVVPGEKSTFKANVTYKGSTVAQEFEGVEWTLEDAKNSGTVINKDTGELTVNAEEPANTVLTIKATSKIKKDLVGSLQVTVTMPIDTINVKPQGESTDSILPGKDMTFTAEVTYNGQPVDEKYKGVKWSLDSPEEGCTINGSSGVLKVPLTARPKTVTVRATSTVPGCTVSGTTKITVKAPIDEIVLKADQDKTTVVPGKSLKITATVKRDGQEVPEEMYKSLDWTVTGNLQGGTTVNGGVLSVAGNEKNGITLTVTATSTVDPTKTKSITIRTAYPVDEIIITEVKGLHDAPKGRTLEFKHEAKYNGSNAESAYSNVTWSLKGVSLSNGKYTTTGGSVFDPSNQTLKIGAKENVGSTLTVVATSTSNKEVTGEYTVTVQSLKQAIIANAQTAEDTLNGGNTDKTVWIDDTEFYVLKYDKAKNEALLMAKDPVEVLSNGFGPNNQWQGSYAKARCKSWLDKKTTIKSIAKEVTFKTRTTYNGSEFAKDTEKVFLLSEADLYGTYNYNSGTAVTDDYTFGEQIKVGQKILAFNNGKTSYCWLRSPAYIDFGVADVLGVGTLYYSYCTYTNCGFRPAFVANLTSLT